MSSMFIIEKGHAAKQAIRKIGIKQNAHIQQWLDETYDVMCIIKKENKDATAKVACFVLLRKMDFDPLHEFPHPLLLNFIFTLHSFRRKGHASTLLKKLVKNNKIVAFCSSAESESLFRKCGFSVSGRIDQWMARHPPYLPHLAREAEKDPEPEQSIMQLVSSLYQDEFNNVNSIYQDEYKKKLVNLLRKNTSEGEKLSNNM